MTQPAAKQGATDADLLREMGTSATRWADTFCAKFPHGTSDWGTMAGWFANAIEAGRSAAPDTAAEHDRLKAANAALLTALSAVPLFSESGHGLGGRWLCLHCDSRAANPHVIRHEGGCWVPMVQAALKAHGPAKEPTP